MSETVEPFKDGFGAILIEQVGRGGGGGGVAVAVTEVVQVDVPQEFVTERT